MGDLRRRNRSRWCPGDGVRVADTYGDAASQVTWDPGKLLRQGMEGQLVRFRSPKTVSILTSGLPLVGKTGKKTPGCHAWIHGEDARLMNRRDGNSRIFTEV